MPHLYVANMTKQHHMFLFNMPESDKQGQQVIRAGEQQIIGGQELSPEAIESIVRQHKAYGLCDVSEIKNPKSFVGHCFSVGKPVSFDQIIETMGHNDEALAESGERRREILAAATAETHQNIMREVGVNVPRVETTIVEERKDGSEPDVAEGYEVTAPGIQPRNPGKRRGK